MRVSPISADDPSSMQAFEFCHIGVDAPCDRIKVYRVSVRSPGSPAISNSVPFPALDGKKMKKRALQRLGLFLRMRRTARKEGDQTISETVSVAIGLDARRLRPQDSVISIQGTELDA